MWDSLDGNEKNSIKNSILTVMIDMERNVRRAAANVCFESFRLSLLFASLSFLEINGKELSRKYVRTSTIKIKLLGKCLF